MSDEIGNAPEQSSPDVVSEQVDSNTESLESQGNSTPSAEDIQAAADNGEISQAEANKLIKKFQLKVKGKVIEREVDLSDDNFLRDQLQLAEMSKLSMQESAEIRKAYERFLAEAKQNPWNIMQELGLDPDELAEMRIQERIEEMKKSPEQLEKERYQKELQEAKEEAKRLKEEKERIEMERLESQAAIQLEEEINEALAGHTTLPNSPYVLKRIADSMLWAINNGFNDVTAADVVPMVEKELREEMNKFMDVMPEEVMEQYIGKKNIERMRKKRIAASKVQNLSSVKPTTQGIKPQVQEKPREKILAKDFFRKR